MALATSPEFKIAELAHRQADAYGYAFSGLLTNAERIGILNVGKAYIVRIQDRPVGAQEALVSGICRTTPSIEVKALALQLHLSDNQAALCALAETTRVIESVDLWTAATIVEDSVRVNIGKKPKDLAEELRTFSKRMAAANGTI